MLDNLREKNENILKEMKNLEKLVQSFENYLIAKHEENAPSVASVVITEPVVKNEVIQNEVIISPEAETPEVEADFYKETVKNEETVYGNIKLDFYTPEEIAALSDEMTQEETPEEAQPETLEKENTPEEEENTPAVAAIERNKQESAKQEAEESIIEKLLGGNLLAKIGIVTLVLGIGFFVKYAIDQGWVNEVGRVAIGLLIGAAIIGVAHKLIEKYNVFSSILTGGGISIFYITVTLAFREYEIFSQPVAFFFLIAITVFSVLLSLLYNRQELAIFSLIGGMLAPLMVSRGYSSYIPMFSYILILNTGMLIVSLKKNWNIIGYVAFVFSFCYIWSWIFLEFRSKFTTGTFIFTTLFFVQFYALSIITHIREKGKFKKGQILMLVLNNMSFSISTLWLLEYNHENLMGLAMIIIAAINAGVMIMLYRRGNIDKNLIYTIIAIITSVVTVAVPVQLEGYSITICWAAQSVILLWLWQRSGIRLFKVGFITLSVLCIGSYLIDLKDDYFYSYKLSPFSNSLFITGLTVAVAFGAMSLLLRRKYKNDAETDKSVILNKRLYYIPETLFLVFLFFVPFIELNYQLTVYTVKVQDLYYEATSFRSVCLAIYTLLYATGLAYIVRNKITPVIYYLILATIALHAISYSYLIGELRLNIFDSGLFPRSYFLVHLLTLPAISYMVYLCVVNIRKMNEEYFKPLCITLVLCSLAIISTEVNNLFVFVGKDYVSYDTIIHDSHTFGYPIFWGISAMILMIWGLKKKEVFLRKISLVSFLVIIFKFYAYDVWFMSQGGRIVSFVLLGVILLVVSFMQQKIKTLVTEESAVNTESDLQNS